MKAQDANRLRESARSGGSAALTARRGGTAWLSDDYNGGETDLPHIGFRYKGGRGSALLFANVDVSGSPAQWLRARAVA